MTSTAPLRIALGYLAVSSSLVGTWAFFAPRSFYDHFPGFGQVWVAVDGPYNEHLVRDVGTLNLALTIVTVAAIYRPRRFNTRIAAVATLANGLPHLLYHAFLSSDHLSASDRATSLTALASFLVVPTFILLYGRRDRPASRAGDM